MLATYPYTSTSARVPVSVSVSGSGDRLGKVLYDTSPSPLDPVYDREVTPIGGSPLLWSDTIRRPANCFLCGVADLRVLLSPDGTSIAVSNATRVSHAATNLYENGALVGAVAGWAVGWIDDNRLLVNVYNNDIPYTYLNASIVSATGQALPTPALSEIHVLQRVTPDAIYSPDRNSVLSVTTGAVLWSSPNSSKGIGAVAAGRAIFASGPHVRAEPY